MPESKPQATRQRRNKSATFAVLTTPEPGDIQIPKLPKRDDGEGAWHRMTIRWWIDIWQSPMAPEFHESDIHGLFALAQVVNDFWTAKTLSGRLACSAEIRLQSQRYGLSPMDRRRLQWQIADTESKQRTNRKAAARDQADTPAQPPAAGPARRDPRAALSSVS